MEKLIALGPDSFEVPMDSAFSKLDIAAAVGKLSPTSGRKKSAVLQNPNKQSITDYDKIMTSHEQSLRKALAQLDKTTESLQAAKEEAEAHEKRHG